MTTRARAALLAGALVSVAAEAREPRILSRWTFDGSAPGDNSVPGGPPGRVERAQPAEGRSGKSLAFEDWSVVDYLKPDPRKATRVVIPEKETKGSPSPLNPTAPFRVSAWIYPTADPVYYGGIAEKGIGKGSSYRLLLLRGLKVQASLTDRHVTVRSSSPVSLNAWHEVALLANGRSLTLFVDGVEAGRAAIPAEARIASSDPLVIGDRFTGRIDDVRISAE